MGELTYVTGNYGKYISVKEQFEKEHIPLSFLKHDAKEPEINDITVIAKAKVMEAYQLLKHPCFAIDSGFYIDHYPGNPAYPGAFVKRSGISSHIEELLDVMKEVKDRSCRFVDCLAFYDGVHFAYFYSISPGTLSYEKRGTHLEKAKSLLWYVFIPKESNKTLAEMSDEELNLHRARGNSATKQFIAWYKENYEIVEKGIRYQKTL